MSGKATAVMWLGIALVLLNLSLNWKSFTSIIFTGSSPTSSGGLNLPPTTLLPVVGGIT